MTCEPTDATYGCGLVLGVAVAVAVGVLAMLVAFVFLPGGFIGPRPSPTPRETPRVWELPSGEGVCVLLGDIPIGCYQKGTAP